MWGLIAVIALLSFSHLFLVYYLVCGRASAEPLKPSVPEAEPADEPPLQPSAPQAEPVAEQALRQRTVPIWISSWSSNVYHTGPCSSLNYSVAGRKTYRHCISCKREGL